MPGLGILIKHMRDIKPLFYIYQIYKYLIFYPLLGMATAVCGTLAAILAVLVGARVGSYMGVLWARFNSFITPMLVEVSGREHIDKNQSYIIVSNHQSQYDIFLIYGWLPIDFKWIMKIELRKVPFLGYACYKLGHIYVDRSNSHAALESINAAKKRIKGGTSIMFFPEGTRSHDGKLRKFKKGAFKLALDMRLPILPVTINNTRKILPNNSTALFPGRVEMIIHEAIDINGYNDKNLQELMVRVIEAIEKDLDI